MVARGVLVGCVVLAMAPAVAAPRAPAKRAPAPPRPVPAPVIAPGSSTVVVFEGQAADIKVAWAPVPGAARYRARLSDAGTNTDYLLPASATTFAQAVLMPGQHQVSVFAIDEHGTESPPAQLAIDVVSIRVVAPGADRARAPEQAAVAIGTRLSSPGLRCALGTSPPAAEVIATTPGALALACGGDAGQPRAELTLVVAPVVVAADTSPLRRGMPEKLHITVASVAPIGDRIEVEAIGDLELGEPERVEGGVELSVTAGPDAGNVGLAIRAGTTELGRVELTVADPPAPPVDTSRSAWFALDLGAHVGALTLPDVGSAANNLGHPRIPGDTLGSGPLFGIRIGLFPTRRVGLELETAIATPSYVDRLGVAAVSVNRLQLAVRMVEDGRFGLRGLIGGEVLAVLTEAGTSTRGGVGGVHYGAAFSVETRRNVSVRFQALHVITVAQDAGYAHGLELQVGVVVRLGRRDRWK